MQKPLIYFDIDKTMLDSTQLMLNGAAALAEIGLPQEVFISTLGEYGKTLKDKTEFDPTTFISKLAAASGMDPELISEKFWLEKNFVKALFAEVIPVLKVISPLATLGVFSQGIIPWQERKLLLAGLGGYFPEEHRIIENSKLSNSAIAKLKPNSWVVDDKEEVVLHLQSARQDLKILWINRFSPKNIGVRSINSLLELVNLQ